MHKKVLLALLLVLAMAMSGCALIEKDMNVDRATEIVRVGDTVYTKGEIQDEVAYQLNYMAYYYSMFGMEYDVNDPQLIAETQQSVINSMIETTVAAEKIEALGLDQLTAEEQAQLDAAAQESWQANLDSIKETFFADTELTGDELTKALEAKAEEMEVPYDYVVEYEKSFITADKLFDHVVADVTITDEELQAGYDEKVAAAKETYASSPATYATVVDNGNTVYYRPAGYRHVKQILVQFNEEDQALIDSLQSKITAENNVITSCNANLTELGVADVAALKAKVNVTVAADAATPTDLATVTDLKAEFDAEVSADVAEQVKQLVEAEAKLAFYNEQLTDATAAAFANIDAEADDVLAQLAAGADWDTLMAEKTDDPGMQGDSVTAKNGYAVSEARTSFDAAFLNAAMALENVGDVSGKVKGAFGYYIIQYTSDVVEGPVALEEVTESLTAELLTTKKNTVYEETVAQWVAEANAKIDYEALNN